MAAVVNQSKTTGIYQGKYRDRNPDIVAAGKLTTSGDTAKECLLTPTDKPTSPEAVRKFRATLRPDPGKQSIFYGKAYDPHLQWASDMTHGVNTQPSAFAGELVNPPPNNRFKQGTLDKREAHYASHKKAPLGRSHDQRPGFPPAINPVVTTFGIKTMKDGSAGELVNPDKTYPEIEEEYSVGRELYRKTHKDFEPGEAVNRKYVSENFQENSKFGIPTPHDNDGRQVRQNLKWLQCNKGDKISTIVSQRVDDFRERTQPQLGQVHDPIKDTMNVPPDHTFGILVKPDEYGAGDLLHGRMEGTFLRGKDQQRGLLAAIRQHLKKANYHNFHDLMAAFRYYDKDRSGKINLRELQDACVQFNLPLEPVLLVQLMDYCDVDRDGLINYVEFANFLNWKDKIPSGLPSKSDVVETEEQKPSSRDSTPRRLKKQIDEAIGNQRTSSSLVNATVGGISTKDYRCYGVPTIRTDLPAPRIRRVDDRTNYGDESDAYGLVNPSIYSQHGVFEKDFLIPRGKEQLRDIFFNMGVKMTLDTFDELYNAAAKCHPKGHVCVESFRNVLDEIVGAAEIENQQSTL